MKSAYELAMERLEKQSGPTKKLSDAQKEKLGGLDAQYTAKIAEARLSFEDRCTGAATYEELNAIRAEQAQAIQALEQKRDAEKDAVWNEPAD